VRKREIIDIYFQISLIKTTAKAISEMKTCFLGNMNNFPFGIAKEFHKRNYQVTQFIDVPKDNLLDRPESVDKKLNADYPDWIVDLNMNIYDIRTTFYLLFPSIFFRSLINKINNYDVIFINGNWLKLAKYIDKSKFVIGLLAGSEVEEADEGRKPLLISNATQKGMLQKMVPRFIYKLFYGRIIQLFREGLKRLNVVNYYLPEINPEGDAVINEIKKDQKYSRVILRGFDTTLFDYIEPDIQKKVFVILNITRFYFTQNVNTNKRNDIMISGIARFIKKNNIEENLKIIFFEKGTDLDLAKKMCSDLDIAKFITWSPVVTMERLKKYFEECDVAFDQLGEQWIGAGLFSMLTGRPLIANGRGDIYEKYLGEKFPVCQADNEDDVCEWLTKIYRDRKLVHEIGLASHNYVVKYFDISHNMNFYIKEINDFFGSIEVKITEQPASKPLVT
jgi:glycosyltransferase involved in cell wall biosynthesis